MCLGNSRKATIFLKAFRDTLGEQWGRELAWKSAPTACLPPPSAESPAGSEFVRSDILEDASQR